MPRVFRHHDPKDKLNGIDGSGSYDGWIKELMEGKGMERPSDAAALDVTFKKAPESKKKLGQQKEFRMQSGAGGRKRPATGLHGTPRP
ncbi:MAG: hypothetical protein ABSD29_13535 [Verrucomicrobiota bacterium]|jgi:hypothetical protein